MSVVDAVAKLFTVLAFFLSTVIVTGCCSRAVSVFFFFVVVDAAPKVRAEFRKVLMFMGFEEMPTNRWVESSFWNFDSLFQPQVRKRNATLDRNPFHTH